MNAIYTSAGFSTHNEISQPRIVRPIDRQPSHYYAIRTLEGPLSSISLPALDSADSIYTSAYLVRIGEQLPTDGDQVRYELTYSTIPAQLIDYESFSFTFPGLINFRAQFQQTVTSKLIRDYFLCASGQTYTTPDAIPQFRGQQFNYGWTGAPADYLTSGSTPSYAIYTGWMSTDQASASSFSIEATDSVLEQYIGNIYVRTRRFIKAR